MRKFTLAICSIALLFTACKKSNTSSSESDEQQAITKRSCASYEVLQEQLKADPTMRQRMDPIEEFTARMIKNGRVTAGTIESPVVVHVIYNTSAQNISDAQVQSQIDVLNEDYAATNSDNNLTPSVFGSLKSAGFGVHFTLADTRRIST